MPLVDVQVIEGVFNENQKQEMISKRDAPAADIDSSISTRTVGGSS